MAKVQNCTFRVRDRVRWVFKTLPGPVGTVAAIMKDGRLEVEFDQKSLNYRTWTYRPGSLEAMESRGEVARASCNPDADADGDGTG